MTKCQTHLFDLRTYSTCDVVSMAYCIVRSPIILRHPKLISTNNQDKAVPLHSFKLIQAFQESNDKVSDLHQQVAP